MRAIPVHRFRALAAALLLLAVGSSPALARRLDVELWTDRGDDAVYREGDAMRIKVRATDDAYLLVYEIDTEGRVNLLYPWKRGSGPMLVPTGNSASARFEFSTTLIWPPKKS